MSCGRPRQWILSLRSSSDIASISALKSARASSLMLWARQGTPVEVEEAGKA